MDTATENKGDRWLIIFTKGEHWLAPLLCPGYGHVYAVRDYGPVWLIVQPGANGLFIAAADKESDFEPVPMDATTVVEWIDKRPWYNHELRPRLTGAFTCVEVVKSCLGIRSHRVHTPKQLYRYLLNVKATKAKDA